MKVKRVITGYLEENCYLVENNNKVLIIDPGDEANKIKDEIGNKKVVGILITHHHFDHVGALKEIEQEYNLKESVLETGMNQIDEFKFEVINTPGHTKDSKSYYFYENKILFTGDFLFKESIGRTDMEGGSFSEMKDSLNIIKKYDSNIIIYPGHGDSSTLMHEINNNVYLI